MPLLCRAFFGIYTRNEELYNRELQVVAKCYFKINF